MKKVMMPLCFLAIVAVATGCGSNSNTETEGDSTATSMETTTDSASPMVEEDTAKSDDTEFAMKAASGGLMEVELGKIAQTNAASAKVKEFGNMMVTDHSKANNELKELAAAKNIMLPTVPSEDHQHHINDLKSKKGAEFDKAYVDMMVDDHKEDIELFEDEVKKGNDAAIKGFASKTLPVLQKHHDSIKKIQDSMKD